MSCDDGSDAATSQGMAEVAIRPLGSRRDAETGAPTQPSERTNPAYTLILDLIFGPPELRGYTFLLRHTACGTL